jgi:hypothetical protein
MVRVQGRACRGTAGEKAITNSYYSNERKHSKKATAGLRSAAVDRELKYLEDPSGKT